MSSIDGQRLILVGRAEGGECLTNIFVGDGTELRSKNLRLERGEWNSISSDGKTVSHIRIERWLNTIDHFETDVLSFFIAIQPEHDDVRSSRFLLEERRHAMIGRRFFFQCFTREQFGLGGGGRRVKGTSTSLVLLDRLCPNC